MASDNRKIKYNDLATTHILISIAVETNGALNLLSLLKICEGESLQSLINPLETTHLYQTLSVSLQRGNAVAFSNTFSETYFFPPLYLILFGNKISN